MTFIFLDQLICAPKNPICLSGKPRRENNTTFCVNSSRSRCHVQMAAFMIEVYGTILLLALELRTCFVHLSRLTITYNFAFQLTRFEIENYNQQTEMESTIEMNQHLQVREEFASFYLLHL